MKNPNSRVYYIEGPDGSGKTTLINNALEETDLKVHNGPYPSSAEAYAAYMSQYESAAKVLSLDPNLTVYIDRGPISEVVYGQVLRSGPAEPPKEFFECLRKLEELNATIIICLPPSEVSKANWKSRLNEEHVKKEIQYNRIYNKYTEIVKHLRSFKGDVVFYDYTTKRKFK